MGKADLVAVVDHEPEKLSAILHGFLDRAVRCARECNSEELWVDAGRLFAGLKLAIQSGDAKGCKSHLTKLESVIHNGSGAAAARTEARQLIQEIVRIEKKGASSSSPIADLEVSTALVQAMRRRVRDPVLLKEIEREFALIMKQS